MGKWLNSRFGYPTGEWQREFAEMVLRSLVIVAKTTVYPDDRTERRQAVYKCYIFSNWVP